MYLWWPAHLQALKAINPGRSIQSCGSIIYTSSVDTHGTLLNSNNAFASSSGLQAPLFGHRLLVWSTSVNRDESCAMSTQQASCMMILIYVALCMFRELERENRKSGWSQWFSQFPRLNRHHFRQHGGFCLRISPVSPSQDWPDCCFPAVSVSVFSVSSWLSLPTTTRRPRSPSYMPLWIHREAGEPSLWTSAPLHSSGLKLR